MRAFSLEAGANKTTTLDTSDQSRVSLSQECLDLFSQGSLEVTSGRVRDRGGLLPDQPGSVMTMDLTAGTATRHYLQVEVIRHELAGPLILTAL